MAVEAGTASEALLKFYRKAAESGNPSAQLSLALRLMKGDAEGKVDFAEVVDLLTRSALRGNVTAAHNLGIRYAVGEGVRRDRSKAAMWFRRAATNGVVAAQYNFAKLMECGWNAPDGAKDERVAAAWYKRAAMQGHPMAACALGIMQAEGRGVEQDWKAAMGNFRKAAGKGVAVAQHNLALCFQHGWGCVDGAADQSEAVAWHRRAAEQGYAPAATSLALATGHGRGVEPADWGEAVALLRVAAEGGFVPAMLHLAACLNKGRGIVAAGLGDGTQGSGSAQAAKEAAAEWLAKAAAKGSATGHYNLGACYASGAGVAGGQNWDRALEHYGAAADLGHVAASYSAGLCLANGKGRSPGFEGGEGDVDWPAAFARFLVAAEKGHHEAAARVALCFAKGRGVEQSWERAVHWYKAAAAAGVDDAAEMLRKCQKYYVRELAEANAKAAAADVLMKAAIHAKQVRVAAEKKAAAEADRLAKEIASATTSETVSATCSPARPATALRCDEGIDDEDAAPGKGVWWHNGAFVPDGDGGDALDLCGDVEYEGGGEALRSEASSDDVDVDDEKHESGGPRDAAAEMLGDDPAEAAVIRRSAEGAAALGGVKNVKNLTVDVNLGTNPTLSDDAVITWYNSAYGTADTVEPTPSTTTLNSPVAQSPSKVQQLKDDMRDGARREAEMRASLRAARRAVATPRASQCTTPTSAMLPVRRILMLPPDQRDDLWGVLGEDPPKDLAAAVAPEALRASRDRLGQLLLSIHPDAFSEDEGERAQAAAATQIVTRLIEMVDGML